MVDESNHLVSGMREAATGLPNVYWADALGKSVALWISDKQDAFVTGIAAGADSQKVAMDGGSR